MKKLLVYIGIVPLFVNSIANMELSNVKIHNVKEARESGLFTELNLILKVSLLITSQHVTGNGPDRAQRHGFLTEARQHPFDVVHEHRAGAHDEHPTLLEAGPVGVQQIGGAVQGHDGFAGAGTAADDRHPLVGGADGLVLLRLDGGDDIAHGAPH